MSGATIQLRELVVSDIKQTYPEKAELAEQVVDRLLELPQMQSDDNVISFINSYRRAMEKRNNANTLQSV